MSVKGGEPPVDPGSRWEEGGFYAPESKRFDEDAEAQAAFKSMPAVSSLGAADLDAVFLAGGHGPLVDFNDPALVKLVVMCQVVPRRTRYVCVAASRVS